MNIRIVLGLFLTLLFLAGLFGNPPSMSSYFIGGGLICLLPAFLLIWSGVRARKKQPATPIPQVSVPSPQSEDDFAEQCLNPQFREQPESRTWKSDPEFSKVLDPLNSGNNDLACREAENLIGKISDFDSLYDWWGTALLRKRAFDQARQVLRQGLDKSRRKYFLCKVLGEVEWNAGNIQQAIYWWTQALHSQELLERYGADEGAYLYLHYVADGIGLPGIARTLISRVDQIRGGQVRLNPPTAENLRSLARKGKTSGIERVVKELGAKYLDQEKAKTPPATSVAATATASSEKLHASTQVKQPDCIGVRFDIGKIDSGGYGEECWKVFWRAVDTEIVAGAQLLDGDSNDTPDRENVYCLAIKWLAGTGRGDDVRKAIEQSEHYRKVASNPNFINPMQVSREPLVMDGRVDQSGRIVGTSYRALPALEKVLHERSQDHGTN